jgi:hypothetical protein
MIDLGDVFRISHVITDPAGNAVTPTDSTITVTSPSGASTVLPAVSGSAVGAVYADFLTSELGRHTVSITSTGPVTAYKDVFDVADFSSGAILSLSDAKRQLNISGSGDDNEIRKYILATTSIIEGYVGATVIKEYVDEFNGRVMLRRGPMVELVSVTALGSSTDYDVADLTVNPFGQLVITTTGAMLCGYYRVTYTAGYSVIPQNRIQAALIIIQHMWDTQRPNDPRRPARPNADEFNPQDAVGRFFSIPRRAVELLEAESLGGVA